MKKTVMTLLALLLVLLPCAVFAESIDVTEEEVVDLWYELSAEDTVLTVRLPGNTKTGLSWSFEISNPEALELITHETIEGEPEGMAGTPTTYVASFMTMANTENSVSLILRCADETKPEEPAVYTRVLDLSTAADNKITINSVLMQEPFAECCEYGDDGYVLTVRMPDAAWNFEIGDPEVLELITCDDSDEILAASFMATMKAAGDVEIIFTSDDRLHHCIVDVFVNESGWLQVNYVQTFDILNTEGLVLCEDCGGWFEEGDVFDEHLCPAKPEEPQPVSFKTVNITGNSVNVRAGVGTGYDVVTVLTKGTNARYLNETARDSRGVEWHKISYKDKTGWMSSQYAKLGGHGYAKIVNGSCNLRSNPSLEGEVLSTVKEGAIVNYLGQGVTDVRGTDWYKVSVSGKEGWVSSKYARFVSSPVESDKDKDVYKYVQISGGNCHMRKSPSVDASSIVALKDGEIVAYLGEKATDDRSVIWYKVSFDGKTGWVSSKYAVLTKTAPSEDEEEDVEEEEEDMRLVYNPHRYDVLRVSDIFSQNGRDFFVTGCFGKINDNGEPEFFDERETVTMPLMTGAEVLLPADLSNPEDIDYVEDPAIWFNDARKAADGAFNFYAGFSMNESGALRNLVFRPVY